MSPPHQQKKARQCTVTQVIAEAGKEDLHLEDGGDLS
jgi:hypothetical protein